MYCFILIMILGKSIWKNEGTDFLISQLHTIAIKSGSIILGHYLLDQGPDTNLSHRIIVYLC